MKASRKGSKPKPRGSTLYSMFQPVTEVDDGTDDAANAVKTMVAKAPVETSDSHAELEEGASTAALQAAASTVNIYGWKAHSGSLHK
ncbi:Hypothetical predicted protein [Pelobates cultripes]|uniref:Uncharacterized protein n=1 Tax=Pelobates cultripes TaxID=61616 RepID=A0AAD1WA77_PELCU|nr:Hypothetical predicted protein [Pelobates cultripes]